MLADVSESNGVSARAIVLRVVARADEGNATDATDHLADGADAGGAAYVLMLTVMPDDGLPFRSRVTAWLPVDGRWNVHVGTHVPVTIAPHTRDVALDIAALRTLYGRD
jgi:hypothetical protein